MVVLCFGQREKFRYQRLPFRRTQPRTLFPGGYKRPEFKA